MAPLTSTACNQMLAVPSPLATHEPVGNNVALVQRGAQLAAAVGMRGKQKQANEEFARRGRDRRRPSAACFVYKIAVHQKLDGGSGKTLFRRLSATKLTSG